MLGTRPKIIFKNAYKKFKIFIFLCHFKIIKSNIILICFEMKNNRYDTILSGFPLQSCTQITNDNRKEERAIISNEVSTHGMGC